MVLHRFNIRLVGNAWASPQMLVVPNILSSLTEKIFSVALGSNVDDEILLYVMVGHH